MAADPRDQSLRHLLCDEVSDPGDARLGRRSDRQHVVRSRRCRRGRARAVLRHQAWDVGLTRAAALDYAGKGIRINAIGPGYIDTPAMQEAPRKVRETFAAAHPLGRVGTRKGVADTVAFLLSDQASFLNGGFYMADGGLTAR